MCLTGACSTDVDCDPGQKGVDNVCRRPVGDACTDAGECDSGFCANGFCCDAACDGPCERCNQPGAAGICRPLDDGTAPAGACGAYLCDGVSGSCPASCQTHDDCRGDSFCDAGECVPQRGDGETCDESAQCPSGSCADGVCCESACAGACETCSMPGKEGLCLARPAGTLGAPTCGTFLCDGASRACPTTCDSNADCASDAICDAGECITQKPNGSACSASDPCPSGFGVSGVCCNTACDQPEGECTFAAECSTGTCTAPPSSTQVACADDGNPCTVDRCDGAGGCEHVPGNPGAVCRAAVGVCDVEETCTGTSAQCPPDQKKQTGTACADDGNVCTSDVCDGTSADCTHPAVADETSCGEVTYGSWGECGGFSGTCDESGTRSRTVTAPRCVSGGCQNVTYTETEPCSRSTGGQSCADTQIGAWGACVYDDATCSNSGSRTRTITQFPSGCTRSTEGMMCNGSWLNVCRSGSCSYCDGACRGSASHCYEPGICVTSEVHCY